jgi:hypothetical protein
VTSSEAGKLSLPMELVAFGQTSSRREILRIPETPKFEKTETHAFRRYGASRQASLTLTTNFQPGQGSGSGPTQLPNPSNPDGSVGRKRSRDDNLTRSPEGSPDPRARSSDALGGLLFRRGRCRLRSGALRPK